MWCCSRVCAGIAVGGVAIVSSAHTAATRRRVSILGSTGSIGVSTLDVLRQHPEKFAVHALAANKSVASMLDQCREFTLQVI